MNVLFDTGHPRPIAISNRLGRRLGLWSEAVPYAPVRDSSIAGPGAALSRIVRGKTLDIGPIKPGSPYVMVHPPDEGGEEAIVGLPLLRTGNLFIQSSTGRVFVQSSGLRPNGTTYSYSGAWVEAASGEVVVQDVGAASPAILAGLKAGDVLDGVDLSTARRMLNARPGSTVSLHVRRPGGTTNIAFKTAGYI